MKHQFVLAATLFIALAAGACSTGTDETGETGEGGATVEAIEVDGDRLRPLVELADDDVPIPTLMVVGLDLDPMIVRADGRADAYAGEASNERSLQIGRREDIVTDPLDAPGRELDVAGVIWEISTFDDLTFATAVDPGVSVSARGLDRETVEAVLNGLRSGPLEAFPTGTYNLDDGAATVFRTIDGAVSLEYTTIGDVPCWTLRGADWLFGDCAPVTTAPDGAVVLQRYAPLRPDGTVGTLMYTAGLVPPDATAVEVSGFDGVVERVEVADLSGDHDSKFFIARSGFDPDRGVSTTTVTVIE